MRTSFEFSIESSDIDDCKDAIINKVAKFLKIEVTEVLENVAIELKVSDLKESEKFQVRAHVQLKYNKK